MKKCPFCAEEIQEAAIVCRYCGRDLPAPNPPDQHPEQTASNEEPNSLPEKQSTNPAKTLLILLVITIFLFLLVGLTAKEKKPSTNTSDRTAPTTQSNYSSPTVYAKDLVRTTKDDWDCSHDSIGNAIFEGKVKNTSSKYDLWFVELRATVFTESGEVVNTNTGYIDSDTLFANSSSTFTIYVDDPTNAGKKCQVTVEDAAFK